MWSSPEKYEREVDNVNDRLSRLEGFLDDKKAKITLAEFLRSNLYFTTYLLTGIKLAPYQEITLRALFNRNFSMCVWGRGCGKSFIASIYCFLQCIFEPNTKILIAGPTFRTARFIFNNIEKIVETKEAALLAQAFGAKTKRNDQYEWKINGGTITAIPLSGEKIRGFRANVLVLDEFLLLPEDIIKNVLMPFLVAPQDMTRRMQVKEIEDELIQQGAMEEKDRTKFANTSKMIALSSASYTFENLYKTYQEWVGKIETKENKQEAKYFVSQLGYEALPEEMIDRTIIDEASEGGSSHYSFQREYCAQFTDGSDSYFSAKKMDLCTLKGDEEPCTLMVGRSSKRYVLGIDPNMSDSPSADYFAMAVMEIDDSSGRGTLVHSYAGLGSLNNHVKYLAYLVQAFNIVFICLDNAGSDTFLDSCNESQFFKDVRVNLKTIPLNADAEGLEYQKSLKQAKIKYNLENNQICFNQVFTTTFIRRANEHLQACIDYKKIWFASRTASNETFFNRTSSLRLPNPKKIIFTGDRKDWSMLDFIEHQDDMIHQTKKQCSLVEHKATSRGSQNFDLPQHLKRSTSPNKARKDNYSALMLANWGLKLYNEITKLEVNNNKETFEPVMLF
tara:strand:- start:4290 stop:6143 length:1854 start_codon:yes stop_codon:yes gene_type:complete